MSAFEHLAVFLSLIFGLATTQVLTGIARSLHRRNIEKLDDVHLVWSVVVLLILVLNWWVFFSWNTHQRWSFGPYLVLVLWAVCHYLLAVTLYEPDSDPDDRSNRMWDENRVWFLTTFALMLTLDIAQAAARGALLEPVWYLPYVLHYFVLTLVALLFEQRAVQRWVGWYVLLTLIGWSFVIRRLLAAT
jgi:hypothetical protein